MAVRYEFDWDPDKAARNLAKHRVTFEDALTIFLDPLALTIPDERGVEEERWITIGVSRATNVLLVVHTYVEVSHDRIYVRLISARKPTKREKRQYEQAED